MSMPRAPLEIAIVMGCLLGLIPWSAAHPLSNQTRSGPVEVEIGLTPEAPVIGDPMIFSIQVAAEPGVEILMPEFGEALDRFRIVDFVPREKVDDSGKTVYSQRYTLQAPASGSHMIPSILIEFVDRRAGQKLAPDNQDAYEILTEGLPFEVESAIPDSVEPELRPPMGRLEKPNRSTVHWLWWVGGGALLAGVAAWLIRRSGRKTSSLTAWEVAQSELDDLLAGPRPEAEQVGPFFVELSDIIRRYLEDRFSLRSPELTTERFLEVVARSPDLSRRHQSLLRDFLRQCDLVKFAGLIPSVSAVDEAIDAARRFLTETRELMPGVESTGPLGQPQVEAPTS